MKELFKPRPGPEWGSGGVFGLTYHKGVIYYTLAMEAEAHFDHGDREIVYRFQQLGPGPASGGDTYNAVDYVDEFIYFGGWVHNPAIFKGKEGFGGVIDFRNKYSHVHEYNINEHSVRLVWSDTIRHETEWAGEVSQIIYDPINDALLIGRADGMRNLGIYRIDRRSGGSERISEVPGLKGSLYLEYACFDMQPNWLRGVDGVQCYGLHERKMFYYKVDDWSRISADGFGTSFRFSGYAISGYARYWHFFRGGVLVGNPLEPEIEEPAFVRLFDFGINTYGPRRSNALEIGGGILAPFNAYSETILHISREDSLSSAILSAWGGPAEHLLESVRAVIGPSALVYITPPTARIVLSLGARITSMAKAGDRVLLGVDNSPNLGGRDAGALDVGTKEILSIPEHELITARSPPMAFRVPGKLAMDRPFGGIPLAGYSSPELKIVASKPNKLIISEYDIGLPPRAVERVVYEVKEGVNRIDLSGFSNIVSFKYESPDSGATTYIILR